MSRGYRIALPLEVARGNVKGADTLSLAIELMPIVGEAEMKDALTRALKDAGWTDGNAGTLVKNVADGVVAEVDAARTQVTLRSTAERTLTATARTSQDARKALADQSEKAAAQVQREATTQLARAEAGARAELDAAIQRTYVEALKQKARSLGQVESVVEGTAPDGSLEVTIKVRA
jgi:hypothetical protein